MSVSSTRTVITVTPRGMAKAVARARRDSDTAMSTVLTVTNAATMARPCSVLHTSAAPSTTPASTVRHGARSGATSVTTNRRGSVVRTPSKLFVGDRRLLTSTKRHTIGVRVETPITIVARRTARDHVVVNARVNATVVARYNAGDTSCRAISDAKKVPPSARYTG